jgi:hypothetical protein
MNDSYALMILNELKRIATALERLNTAVANVASQIRRK